MGASCTKKFTFKSKKKGTHQINLVYKRPWEKQSEDIQTVTVTFG
jgi:predicted secreted protein